MITASQAYFFVVHGSRNPYYQRQVKKLSDLIKVKLPYLAFTIAYLELSDQSLSTKITDFAVKSEKEGYKNVYIVPLFLLSGTHVLEDIPQEVNLAQKNSLLPLQLIPSLGQSSDLLSLLELKYQQYPHFDRILFCHGTTIEQGHQQSLILADKLNANIAYWSMKPDLITTIEQLVSRGSQGIVILPYFLFSGKIIDTIVLQIEELVKKINIPLQLISPLGATEELTDVIIKIIQSTDRNY